MKSVLTKWSAEKEMKIWKEAIFIFDTSVLLNFLEFLHSYRQDIYVNIFSKLKGRLFITNYAEYEFLKNKEKVMNNPKEEYRVVKEKHFPDQHLQKFLNQYDQLKSITAKENKHPYLKKEVFEEVDKQLEEVRIKVKALEKNMELLMEEQIREHSSAIEKDNLLDYFEVTPGFTYQEIMQVMEEGEFRYRNKIPPGYMDEKEKADLGTAKYGDLICWKQALKFAKEKKKPVLLICDDLKEDWCIMDAKDKRKMDSPRFELIKEMQDVAGVEFWSYNSPQFLHLSKKILQFHVDKDAILILIEQMDRYNETEANEAVLKYMEELHEPETINWDKEQGIAVPSKFYMYKKGVKMIVWVRRAGLPMNNSLFLLKVLTSEPAFNILNPVAHIVVFVTDNIQDAKRVNAEFERKNSSLIVVAGYLDETKQFCPANTVEEAR